MPVNLNPFLRRPTMNKKQDPVPDHTSGLIDVDSLSEWIQKYGAVLAYAFLGIVVALVIVFQFARRNEKQTFADYMKAERTYQQFVGSDLQNNPAAFQTLVSLMEEHSDLRQKYEGKVAQALIAKGEGELAAPYLENMVARSKKEGFASFTAFTEATRLINEGELDAAYKQSLELQSDLKAEDELYAFNLLRLATLEGKLGLWKQELQHWEEILEAAEQHRTIQSMLAHVQEGQVNLTHYVQERVNKLRN